MPVYLSSFSLPIEKEERLIRARAAENGGRFPYIDNIYPCHIFDEKDLGTVAFGKVTVFYGGNGSGKSTLLNLIAQKLELKRIAPFNSGELFDAYVEACSYSMGCDDEGDDYRIPNGSRIITSDDVFDYMLAVRANNKEIGEGIEAGKEEYAKLKFGSTVQLNSMDDYEALRLQVLSRKKSVSRRQFLRREVGKEIELCSNGETALKYFKLKLSNDTLYCLDEPENSMSPKMQLELKNVLEDLVRFYGCQLIIATHSPFLLALKGARIYDLDSYPAEVKDWWELENAQIYYDFFAEHKKLFENRKPKPPAQPRLPGKKADEVRPRFRLMELQKKRKYSWETILLTAQICKPYKDKDAIAERLLVLLGEARSEEEAIAILDREFPDARDTDLFKKD